MTPFARPATALRAAAAPLRTSGWSVGDAVPDGQGTASRRPKPLDVLFGTAVGLLVAVHLTIFVAVLVLAPVTATEAETLALVQLPVEVARVVVLPFHALLLGCLFVLGRRAAGRWAGFGAMLAVLALDLRADATDPVFGPPTAEGGWIAASLLALAFVLLQRRRAAAALLVGTASGFFPVALLALPAFLGAIAIHSPQRGAAAAWRSVGVFAGLWAIPAAALQLIWIARLGPAEWAARAAELGAEFTPHVVLPWLEQERILFAAWHFAPLVTVTLASFLFVAAGTGVARYLLVPAAGETGSALPRVLRRLPAEFWAAGLMILVGSVWWGLSGDTEIILPNLPALAAATPLITAMAYRGAKWLLTVNRFWFVAAVLYLVGLILARTTQLVITLVQAFQY